MRRGSDWCIGFPFFVSPNVSTFGGVSARPTGVRPNRCRFGLFTDDLRRAPFGAYGTASACRIAGHFAQTLERLPTCPAPSGVLAGLGKPIGRPVDNAEAVRPSPMERDDLDNRHGAIREFQLGIIGHGVGPPNVGPAPIGGFGGFFVPFLAELPLCPELERRDETGSKCPS